MTTKVHKLVEKKHIGYRYTTVDFVTFETNIEKSQLTIDNCDGKLFVDMTPKTIEMLYEFFRYLKSDLDD